MKSISVVIPALNEEKYLGETLQWVEAAIRTWQCEQPGSVGEVIVVDNDSTDRTAEIARNYDAKVVTEKERNISRARNAGDKAAAGEVFLFLDADTHIPTELLKRIATALTDPACDGGAVAVQHLPERRILRLYMLFWKIVGRMFGMAQGAAQFYRRSVFEKLRGYPEHVYMGEDVEFYWAASKAAKRGNRTVEYIKDLQVVPSPRRFDQWPLWKKLLWTNPLAPALLRWWKWPWSGWYKNLPR